MKIKIYQVDAFSDNLFEGNPAAVCILDKWLKNQTMQKIAEENNLSETAFAVKKNNFFELRWFTPIVEVELCGHATLATAHVLFKYYEIKENEIQFSSVHSGILKVTKENGYLTLDFPVGEFKEISTPNELIKGLKKRPIHSYRCGPDFMLIYSSQQEVEDEDPDFHLLSKIKTRGIIVTAQGDDVDFVSRFFAPRSGINEDPVTGSAHTVLTPYWTKKLHKKKLTAVQLSKRRGILKCRMEKDRVFIAGRAVIYLTGEIEIPD
jgi:PhzF family phenazine biosynthesis protein